MSKLVKIEYERDMPEVNRALLEGCIDIHLHPGPSTWLGLVTTKATGRLLNAFELAEYAREVGMRAVAYKNHDYSTAPIAWLVRKIVPGIDVFGGVVLNYPVGGLNPTVIDLLMRYDGLGKIVWLPTKDAAADQQKSAINRRKEFGHPEGISIIKNGALVPEMEKILDLIAEHNLVLCTSHIGLEEKKVLVEETKRRGLKKVVITHPEGIMSDEPDGLEILKKFVDNGAYLEFCGGSVPMRSPAWPTEKYVEIIDAVGPEHCIMTTDRGQIYLPSPVDSYRCFISQLQQLGVEDDVIYTMAKEVPAKLLDLE